MVLIDTHVLIWALYESGKLSDRAATAIRENDCCISIASLWEMSIKMSKGTLRLRESITAIAERCLSMGLDILAITPQHCEQIQVLPDYHHDPFDRIIIAQAMVEGYALVTRDENIWKGYDMIDKIW